MTEWIRRTLGDIAEEVDGTIRTGPFGSQLHQSDYVDEGIPVVMPKNIIDFQVDTSDIAYITEEDANRLAQHRLCEGDIVYGRRGDIGRQALVKYREIGWLCGTGCLRISLGDSVVLPQFLHYYLRNPEIIDWIYNQAVGATMPNLNTTILGNVPINYPPLETQRRIAQVLSAYDDLIENNTRRIQALEQAAHDLYREWFVEFRFPGHEAVEMVDSELGQIPQGWEAVKFGVIAQQKRETVHPHDIAGDTPYVGLAHIPQFSLALSNWGRADETKSSKVKFCKGEIIFAKIRPYLHKVVVAPLDGVASSDSIIIIPRNEILFGFVAVCASGEDFVAHTSAGTTGTQMPRADWDFMAEYRIALPPDSLLDRFNEIVIDHVNNIHNMIFRNKVLRETRDLLLPRLVSGQLDVSDIELPEDEYAD